MSYMQHPKTISFEFPRHESIRFDYLEAMAEEAKEAPPLTVIVKGASGGATEALSNMRKPTLGDEVAL